MKSRNIWVRRKKEEKKPVEFIVELRTKSNKVKYVWTISKDITKLLNHLLKTSYFTKEKEQKIRNLLRNSQ